MITSINILIIDDHPTMVEGYKSILSINKTKYNINFTTVHNCEGAFKILSVVKIKFDIVFLDIILPPYESQKLFSGEDLVPLIRIKIPAIKIIVITSHTDSFKLYHIIKTINPDGLLVKSDFTPVEFILAFEKIYAGYTFYSATAEKSIKEINKKDVYLDANNRRIISLLSKGIKTKNLPLHLNLSISAIDKRKVSIKDFFNIEKGNDEDIIREARNQGYI